MGTNRLVALQTAVRNWQWLHESSEYYGESMGLLVDFADASHDPARVIHVKF
jgi:hypothetical protein